MVFDLDNVFLAKGVYAYGGNHQDSDRQGAVVKAIETSISLSAVEQNLKMDSKSNFVTWETIFK